MSFKKTDKFQSYIWPSVKAWHGRAKMMSTTSCTIFYLVYRSLLLGYHGHCIRTFLHAANIAVLPLRILSVITVTIVEMVIIINKMLSGQTAICIIHLNALPIKFMMHPKDDWYSVGIRPGYFLRIKSPGPLQ